MSSVLSKWAENSKEIRNLFASAIKSTPALVFIDDLEELFPEGDLETPRRVKTELLVQLNGVVNTPLAVVGATSAPWKLDSAIRRR